MSNTPRIRTTTEIAAQLWCLPQHENKVMDVEFAKSIVEVLDLERKRAEGLVKVLEQVFDSRICDCWAGLTHRGSYDENLHFEGCVMNLVRQELASYKQEPS